MTRSICFIINSLLAGGFYYTIGFELSLLVMIAYLMAIIETQNNETS